MATDWPPRFRMTEMTPADGAKFLRRLAETTAKRSRDWDAFEGVAEAFLLGAWEGGRANMWKDSPNGD